jgi:hypothetical protein
MKIRKSLIGVGAALIVVGASAYANPQTPPVVSCGDNYMKPNPVEITNSLKDLADYLSSEDRLGDPNFPDKNYGPWTYKPIWQKRGMESYDVQNALVRKLYEYRTATTKPPKNNNNDAAGAAWDIRNGKYDAARDKLLSFKNDVRKKAKDLNDWGPYDPVHPDDRPFPNAGKAAEHFLNEVDNALGCVCKLTVCDF